MVVYNWKLIGIKQLQIMILFLFQAVSLMLVGTEMFGLILMNKNTKDRVSIWLNNLNLVQGRVEVLDPKLQA